MAAVIAAGLIVWAAIGMLVTWGIIECLLAAANSISFHNWVYHCAKVHGRADTLRWSRLPLSLIEKTGALFCHRKGSVRYFNETEGGEWYGIGDWNTGGRKL